MTLDRRTILKGLAGSAVAAPLVWPRFAHAAPGGTGPKRVVFFLQNHGFCPAHAHPRSIEFPDGVVDEQKEMRKFQDRLDRTTDEPLADHTLPRWIDPLEPIKDRVTIVHGLNGKHVAPYHGAPFGALGGFKKSASTPAAETIDCALARRLPAVVPLLAFGWESLPKMRASRVAYASSAWGASMPAPMYCDPLLAFDNLFGVARPGRARDEFEAETELFDFVGTDARALHARLGGEERPKFAPYVEGLETIAQQRRRLQDMTGVLREHSPDVTKQFTEPEFESDWWDASLDVGLAAMVAGVTNVLTIASGLCTAAGSWQGLGLKHVGHSIGHTNQEEEDDWLVLRRHNMQQLLRIVRRLESVPEGEGTMMDHTLVVYSSCHGETQHSSGDRWPFLTIGDFGGRLRTGRYLHLPLSPHEQSRTTNAFYATLLHAAGDERDHFNLDGKRAGLDSNGPIEALLA